MSDDGVGDGGGKDGGQVDGGGKDGGQVDGGGKDGGQVDGGGKDGGPVDGGAEGESAGDRSGASVAARDDLAGIVDLFGVLTRAELCNALSELAFKAGAGTNEDALDATVTEAIREYYLVPIGPVNQSEEAVQITERVADDDRLAVGPAAFPSLPRNAEDLPHIMNVPDREVDRAELGETVHARLRADADAAIDAGDGARMEELLDVCYDLEVWAPVEADDVIDRLSDALE